MTMLTRRCFVRTAANHAGAVVVTATVAGGSIVLTTAGARYAYALEALSEEQAAALLQIARVLFPHRRFGDETYAVVVASLDSDAAANPGVKQMLSEGLAALDEKASGAWVDADPAEQAAIMKELEGTPFFGAMHFKASSTIYDQPEVWRALGYEGPSFDRGGYLHRGFNDLQWLPDPPPEASGPVDA